MLLSKGGRGRATHTINHLDEVLRAAMRLITIILLLLFRETFVVVLVDIDLVVTRRLERTSRLRDHRISAQHVDHVMENRLEV